MREIALITGASSGIGRALAVQFAAHGYDLVLVARDRERLEALAGEMTIAHGTTSLLCAEDLADPKAPSRILAAMADRGLSASVLVNNAGYTVHGCFIETALLPETNLIQLQLAAMLELTKGVLPAMRLRRSGRILNVGSLYSYVPVPYQAVYAACKAFLLSFSDSLASEVTPFGITVTVLCPGVTRTEFRTRAGIARHSAKKEKGLSAEEVAAYAYRACLKGKAIAIPGFINKFFLLLVRFIPARSLTGLMRLINNVRGVNRA